MKAMEVAVEILSYTCLEFPTWVKCCLEDAYGRKWFFVEKLPVVSKEASIDLPCKGYLRGNIISEQNGMVEFCTKEPDDVESVEGCNRFWISKNQLFDNKQQTD